MLLPTDFFGQSPGIPLQNFSCGFQPEIGSVGIATFAGLKRFMSLVDIENGFPLQDEALSHSRAWEFHKFTPWTSPLPDNQTYDHVYAYFSRNDNLTAEDWVAAAHLAAHSQYQNLFNGCISHIFEYTSAVFMWKSQAPWPSLRGFLYDWYLETTGSLRGTRAALGSHTTFAFDPLQWQVRMVNRQVFAIESSDGPIGVNFTWVDVSGNTIISGSLLSHSSFVPAMSSMLLDGVVPWAKECSSVCFLRLIDIRDSENERGSWHWLTDPSLGLSSSYSLLGHLRKRNLMTVDLILDSCKMTVEGIYVGLQIIVGSTSSGVLFYPTFSIAKVRNHSPILPLIDDKETDVVLRPGTRQSRTLFSSVALLGHSVELDVSMQSWNTLDLHRRIVCYEANTSVQETGR
jgi:hypothetical protein